MRIQLGSRLDPIALDQPTAQQMLIIAAKNASDPIGSKSVFLQRLLEALAPYRSALGKRRLKMADERDRDD